MEKLIKILKEEITNIITIFLIVMGLVNFISSLIYVFNSDDKWFSREILAAICFGFVGIIIKLNKK